MKSATTLLSILALVGAIASVALYVTITGQKAELTDTLQSTQAELNSARSTNNRLEREKTELTETRDQLSTELEERNALLEELDARYTESRRENAELRSTIAQREQRQAEIDRQLVELRRQLADARSRAAEAETIPEYRDRIAQLEATLARFQLRPDEGDDFANVPRDLAGRVLQIGPENAFIILDIGSTHGAVSRLPMVLERNGQAIARVTLTNVRERLSVGHIAPDSLTDTIQAGDRVTRLN